VNNKKKFAFAAFYPVLPNISGSSEVSGSFFRYWPSNNKKFFYITHLRNNNNNNNKKFQQIKIIKENTYFKIISLIFLCYKIIKFLKKTKQPYLIVEGPSWIFYSYVTITIIKFFIPNAKIIYHSHSIEYEIRKKFSNKFISCLTYYLEKKVFQLSDISTSVSKNEYKKIHSLYKKKTIIFENGIDLNFIKKIPKKKTNYKFIIYTGSYLYKPNKEAIDILIKNVMPKLLKLHPNLKLIITGGGYNKKSKYKWLVDKGKLKKRELYYYLKHAECLVTPLLYGSGTRIKIIEALCVGTKVITTSVGIDGIEFVSKNNNPLILNNIKFFSKHINKLLANKNNSLKKKDTIFYRNKFSMQNITANFYKKVIN
jgi:glycosyltransferase involved in cell wall biosynthesis